MTGEGHEDWVSGVEFHPSGDLLASCGGDGVLKIWNFSELSSVLSLEEHRQPGNLATVNFCYPNFTILAKMFGTK